jgi:hypothetical protein
LPVYHGDRAAIKVGSEEQESMDRPCNNGRHYFIVAVTALQSRRVFDASSEEAAATQLADVSRKAL